MSSKAWKSSAIGVSIAGQIAEIYVSLGETAIENHTTIERREIRDVMREPIVDAVGSNQDDT